MSRQLLQETLRELADQQPAQPDRVGQVLRRHRRASRRRGGVAILAAVGVGLGVLTVGHAVLPGQDSGLSPARQGTAWDGRYIAWQAEQPGYTAQNAAAVDGAWRTWSRTATNAPDSLKAIGVHTGPVSQVVFEAPNSTGDLRLVSVELAGQTGLVIEDVPAPDPAAVLAIAVFGQRNADGTLRDLSQPQNRDAPPASTTNSLTMFVPPTTANPHMRFTAPPATTGDGISTGSFDNGVLAWGIGNSGRGPVAASDVHVTIWDGDAVLFSGGPWLTRG
jgi:hypothetical protein